MTSPAVKVTRHTPSSRIAIPIAVLLLLAIPTLPYWAGSGQIRWIIELGCLIAIAQMWNLLAGFCGMVSVGQQAFIGLGGYSLFVIVGVFGLNPFWSVPLAVMVRVLVAAPSYLLLRNLDGPYFAIETWVLAETLRRFVANLAFVNAGSGMSLSAMAAYTPHQRDIGLTILCALLLTTVGGTYVLLRSRLGLALTAMRDDPVSAASQGVDVSRMRFWVFVLAAGVPGLPGRSTTWRSAGSRPTADSTPTGRRSASSS